MCGRIDAAILKKKWSMVSCHFRMRLRRGILRKILREAPPPMTTDK
jgi:hypothetical protein